MARETAILKPVSIKHGSLYEFPIQILDSESNPVDLTDVFEGDGALAQMRVSEKSSTSFNGVVEFPADGVDGRVVIKFLPAVTLQTKVGQAYKWDLRLEFSNENVWYPIEQTVKILPSYSRE